MIRKRRNPVSNLRAERFYGRQLKKIARHVGDIINGFPPGDPEALPTITEMLRRYAEALGPWAEATARKMLEDVHNRDKAAWAELSKQMSFRLAREIKSAPTGETMRKIMNEQVDLIKSLPLEAAKRVHEMTIKGIEDSKRFREYAAEIMRSGEVTQSRAVLIARTETSRTATALIQSRAQHIGSEGYIWMTSHDGAVRKDHKALDGKFFRWDDPPIADQHSGVRAHPGAIYNCRCWPKVVLPE